MTRIHFWLLILACVAGCTSKAHQIETPDGETPHGDASMPRPDAAHPDAAYPDAATPDATTPDTGCAATDRIIGPSECATFMCPLGQRPHMDECGNCGCIQGPSCDPAGALCDSLPPECPEGLVPSVVGHCWGDCVDELWCRDRRPESCRAEDAPGVRYVGHSAAECAVIDFACNDAEQYFTDDCGCGCEPAGAHSCGASDCGAREYCEIVVSDIPEFDGDYRRYRCQPIPTCGTIDDCGCIEMSRCEYGSSHVGGRCEATAAGITMTCDIGG